MLDKPSSVTKRIHQELADRAGRSSEDAYAMPAEFYTSVDFLEEEIEILTEEEYEEYKEERKEVIETYVEELEEEILELTNNEKFA